MSEAGRTRRAPRPRNRILAVLPEAEYARLAPALERVTLEARQVCFDVDCPIEHVYFPEHCVASIVGISTNVSAVETGTVGREGMVGLPVFLGGDRTTAQAFCQVAGEALRLESDVLRRELARSRELPRLLGRYTQAFLTQVTQTAACNRLHEARQRCARWLLQTHDRVGADDFPFTHEFLSQMLGVSRPTVTEIAGEFERAGLIRNHYARIAIRDRNGLEALACECYAIIRREYDRLLEGRESPSPLDGLRTSRGGKSLTGDGSGEGADG